MSVIRPFDTGGWFVIHNYVFDHCMPRLSGPGWKVLCVAMRQTWGYRDPEDSSKRKEWDSISFSQFRDKAHLGSYSTVNRAIQENLDAGYLVRRAVGRHPGTGKPIYAYALNRDFEVDVPDSATTESVVAAAATTGSVVAPTTETVVAATTETVVTKEQKKNNKRKDVVVGEVDGLGMLLDFGVEPVMAHRLAGRAPPERIQAWIAYARGPEGASLRDPVGFLVRRLSDHAPPPTAQTAAEPDRRSRFLGGPFAEFIES